MSDIFQYPVLSIAIELKEPLQIDMGDAITQRNNSFCQGGRNTAK